MIPDGCGISRAPDGTVKMTGAPAKLAAWWIRDMKGRPCAEHAPELIITDLAGSGVQDDLPDGGWGVWWNDQHRGTRLTTWAQVHRDLGESFLRAARS